MTENEGAAGPEPGLQTRGTADTQHSPGSGCEGRPCHRDTGRDRVPTVPRDTPKAIPGTNTGVSTAIRGKPLLLTVLTS